MEIYWIKDKQRQGPGTVPDVIDLIHRGELNAGTKGWHAGVQGWKPLSELPALADFLREEEKAPEGLPTPPAMGCEPLPPQSGAPEKGVEMNLEVHMPQILAKDFVEAGIGRPSASLRMLARAVDTLLYLALALGVLYVLNVPYNEYLMPGSLVFWLPMILLEAYCLHRWNTTPGKWLMGICVCTLGPDADMGYGRAVLRSFFVFILGVGMLNIPFMPIMMLFSLWALRKRGICWWDLRALTLPVKKETKIFSRILTALATLYVCCVAAGIFLKPWIKPMYDELSKVNPEAAKFMLNMLPELHDQLAPEPDKVPQPLE